MKCTFITILMPCLNEAETLQNCIRTAKSFLQTLKIPGEIIIADNGSKDGSVEICKTEHVSCIHIAEKGYGAALHAGILASAGSHVIFADADMSYDFNDAALFVNAFDEGYDMVIGNRFIGSIEKGAMPLLHRYLGTPVISYLGRKSFRVNLGDFNCGMRGISKQAYVQLNMQSAGMEFATEMIARAAYKNLHITEVPVHLYNDGRNRPPHLNTWRDGWRHFRLILLLSPKWLLLYPAIFFLLIGLLFGGLLLFSYVRIANLVLDIHTLYFSSVFVLLAFQLFQFYIIAKMFGSSIGLYAANKLQKGMQYFGFEKGLFSGIVLFFSGVMLSLYAVLKWKISNFGPLDPVSTFRIIIPAGFLIMLGMQLIIFSFILSSIQQLPQKKLNVI